MICDSCGHEITVYELYLRSYRLYVYLCRSCRKGFLAHHFDLNLEIYQMEEVGMKEKDGLVFITGLSTEPRVFDFKVDRSVESVVVADGEVVLGELALGEKPLFAPYSERSKKRLQRLLGLQEADGKMILEKVVAAWEQAK
ncbi:MAG: hypothetical protein D6733_05295 [Methanobacteriota archaeon]|nr:MAG: hypothetical protein D6733_05295 [Euryarchaeota archaeon]